MVELGPYTTSTPLNSIRLCCAGAALLKMVPDTVMGTLPNSGGDRVKSCEFSFERNTLLPEMEVISKRGVAFADDVRGWLPTRANAIQPIIRLA